MRHFFRRRALAPLLGAAALVPLSAPAVPPRQESSLRVVLVGSGPDLDYNQVAIESNIRYLNRILPPSSERTVLFADGDVTHKTVLYEDDPRRLPAGESLLFLAMKSRREQEAETQGRYKTPNLGSRCKGANTPPTLRKVLDDTAQVLRKTPSPLFLYFTGHGSINPRGIENNVYEMWGDKRFSVTDLAEKIEALPSQVPVTLVMVQCHSGAFANLLFRGGDPRGEAVDRDFAGFFAAIKENVAAGCTSELNEDDYRDFTSYFFAALTGRDRLGRTVPSADFNRDGRVGMDEAYCDTLAKDRSIDVPVATSDVFLRKIYPLTETEEAALLSAPFADVLRWASPAQRFALLALSDELKLGGEDRLTGAYHTLRSAKSQKERRQEFRLSSEEKHYDALQESAKRILLGRFPKLARERGNESAGAKREAVAFLALHQNEAPYKNLREAYSALSQSFSESERKQIEDAHRLRLIRLGKTVLLARKLQTSRREALKARFARLLVSEGRTLLPPHSRM